MSLTFSIRVTDENGYPRSDVGVGIDFGFVGPGFAFETEYTNSDGWAEFDLGIDQDGIHVKTIYIDSDEADSDLYLSDGDTRSYSI